ncbi:MAG: cupin domain-containing protein [Candidatus Omnitrophica bacterium]|nr:cupin domain-containing protein [Candidatus Omnitrophota bacterium]MCA9431039.1 cupin domain-containing protein [Candidatus Omnitrophota bacterium]MCB9767787.1 cupin domain-containing protein [Candidatus Omnitrophota bacterium]
MDRIEQIIQKLGLEPHPTEGGFFVETYRSEDVLPKEALPGRYPSDRNCSTAIYYLLKPGTFSEMHRLPTDEIFHFYLGDPVTMLQLFPDGSSKTIVIGNDVLSGERPQVVVPKGVWQGTCLSEGGEFALLGCTVSPGFDFEDYESGNREKLIREYPDQEEMIARLTHPE